MEQNWQQSLEPIIRKAGDILLSYYNKPLIHHEKTGQGFVTDADMHSERFLIQELSLLFPQAGIWAEESGKTDSSNNEYYWVIDPLDGTTNFAQGLPYFCISVALTRNNIPIIGAIYQPISNEFFYAQQNYGAFLNNMPIQVSSPEQFNQAIIALGLPYRHDQQESLINTAQTIIRNAYAMRHYGAIALDLAYVACGKLDGVFLAHLKWWDIAAGIVLIEQAGGMATDFNQKPLGPDFKTGVAGGKMVHNYVVNLLSH